MSLKYSATFRPVIAVPRLPQNTQISVPLYEWSALRSKLERRMHEMEAIARREHSFFWPFRAGAASGTALPAGYSY